MTAVKVIDASAVAALMFDEPEAETIADRLGDARLAAPALLDYELANVCRTKIRRSPAEKDSIRASLREVRTLAVETIEINHLETLDLALATGLTAYDASYLWLAHTLDAELITLDRKLAASV